MDYNVGNNDRIFVRGSKNTFIEGVGDWTYEVPEFAGLHSIDRSRPQWNMIGNWTHTTGTMVIDTQVSANRFTQGDLLERLHEYKPTDMGLPSYLDDLCTAQENCMLPNVDFTGNNTYQDISQGASSFDRARNMQRTVNVTKVTSSQRYRAAHTEQPRVDHGGVHAWGSVDDGRDHPAPVLLSQPVLRHLRPGFVAREREPHAQRRSPDGVGKRYSRRRQCDGDRPTTATSTTSKKTTRKSPST